MSLSGVLMFAKLSVEKEARTTATKFKKEKNSK